MNPAVFLDRDGVICEEKNYVHRKEDFVILPKVAEAIRLLNQNRYKVIVVTNQGGIAKGLYSLKEMEVLHEHMIQLLLKEKASIDKIYFCPHHPGGVIPEYRQSCLCRKPSPGMLHQAQRDFHLYLKESFLVGDKTSDIKAGERAGCKTILVETGYGGKDATMPANPHFKAKDLYTAVTQIILPRKSSQEDNP